MIINILTQDGLRPYPLGVTKVTYCSMTYTDGTNTRFGVYQCKLYVRRTGKPFVNLAKANRIGTVEWTKGAHWFDYIGEAAKYATPEYPAFDFGHTENIIKEQNETRI